MFAGDRFVLDLDHNPDDSSPAAASDQPPFPSSETFSPHSLIGEIRERHPTTASTPPPPKPPSGAPGFPQHRQRVRRSAFKQQRSQGPSGSSASASTVPASSSIQDEKSAINEENRRRLAAMSPSQIEHERSELMESLDSSLLQRFLRRANIDDTTTAPEEEEETKPRPSKKSVSFNVSEQETLHRPSTTSPEDRAPLHPPEDLLPASQFPSAASFHFPTPPPRQTPMPNLDPSSPSFLSDLQSHYFPDLPHDPSLVSWLQPPPADDPEDPEASRSAYHPSSNAVSVAPAAIRFSLLGTILSPSTSLALPTSLGLHHHGNDPHAAGYTIPELAILGRSSFPAQRCLAWQVLGRVLFRLGKGQFGERGSTLVDGLWDVIEREAVVAGMLAEADGGSDKHQDATPDTPAQEGEGAVAVGKHASATAWAVEGLWLWQTGGGGDRGLLKDGAIRSQ